MKRHATILMLMIATVVQAGLRMNVGGADLSDWDGATPAGNGAAVLKSGAMVSYVYSNQNRIYFPGIARNYFGDSADWSEYAGIAFEVCSGSDAVAEISVVLKVDPRDAKECNPVSTATIRVAGKGWHSVYVPWDLFDIDVGQKWGTLLAIKRVELSVKSQDGAEHWLRNVYVAKGRVVALQAAQQGKAAAAGSVVGYEVEVGNTTDQDQSVQLRIETVGWESMAATIDPSFVDLAPGETKTCRLSVSIPSKLPPGIREKQMVKAISNGEGAAVAALEFVTAVRLPTPNIMFTAEKWQGIREKAEQYGWAKQGLEDYERRAGEWKVPEGNAISAKAGESVLGLSIFNTDGKEILDCAIAYQLTGKKEYAEKCLAVIRRLVREEDGYPATLVGGGNSFVAEGKFWQSIGRTYDLIRDCERVTDEDRRLVDRTFRLFATRTIKGNSRGAISNWNVAELTAAVYCALNLQDWHLIDQLLTSPSGIYKHLEHGIMNDGWWYECAVGYNTWVASEFSEIALALEPWGIDFKNMRFPLGTTRHFSLLASRREGGIYGMQFEKWGNLERNSVGIKDMWDATLPFLDYRGVVLAVNDAIDAKVSGKPYEMAYYLYRDPEYAAVIQRGNDRDLLYGVPDLPKVVSSKMKESAYADNMGIVQLRSQTKGREQREQIQAALHYGSHGGYHGHFDRTGLVSMMRYGRSFYGPLMYWYGYDSYLYKFLKQTSTTKNMVVVDGKMQEPVENHRTLFHTGDMMQATALETVSRWSYPPYGGIVYDEKVPFAQKMWEEGRSIPVPENAPAYGACTGYTEPVVQRRVMVMMDDYIVLADFLKGEREHRFDWMFQVKGFKGITADRKEYLRHDGQMDANPIGSGQFVTDCDWYRTEGTAQTRFEMQFGENADNAGIRLPHSEAGLLKIDVYTAWPKQQEIMVGTAPASFKVNKKLWYSIAGDGETLLEEKTGAWILGSKDIDVDIAGKKQLVLATKVDNTRNNTIFWGNARVVLRDGSERFVSELPLEFQNLVLPAGKGLDYYHGPVKIAGEPMDHSTPGMPKTSNEEGRVVVDLSGLDAVSFKARIGGDFPMGKEAHRLKTMAVRTAGTSASFLSVVEPYEGKAMVKAVSAKSAGELVVELADGRTQEINISGLDQESNDQVKVSVVERVNGNVVRQEKTF